MKKYLLACLVFTVLLFLWSGFTQVLPWGIPTTQKITVQSDPDSGSMYDLIHLPPNALTTVDFDFTFNQHISTYTTDHTFSWIVTQPLKATYTDYFIAELITQFVVGILLTILLALTRTYNTQKRMMCISGMALLAWTATYGQFVNWWGMPIDYAVGIGVNLVVGWLFTAFLVSKFIVKSEKTIP
jgi:hypothetical protein